VSQNEAEAEQQRELTPRERAAVKRLEAAEHLRLVADGEKAKLDHPSLAAGRALLMEALGTTNPFFRDGLMRQLHAVSNHEEHLDIDTFNFLLAMVTGEKPRTERAAVLMAQFAAVDLALMKTVERYKHTEHMHWKNHESRIQSEHMLVSMISRLARTSVGLSDEVTRCQAASGQAFPSRRAGAPAPSAGRALKDPSATQPTRNFPSGPRCPSSMGAEAAFVFRIMVQFITCATRGESTFRRFVTR
jgi:hypothetical protein